MITVETKVGKKVEIDYPRRNYAFDGEGHIIYIIEFEKGELTAIELPSVVIC